MYFCNAERFTVTLMGYSISSQWFTCAMKALDFVLFLFGLVETAGKNLVR
jgi:hypothetical protein